MDTGEGTFKQFSEFKDLKELRGLYPNSGGVFKEGEILEIKGSRFEVSKIIRNGLKLRLLPKEK